MMEKVGLFFSCCFFSYARKVFWFCFFVILGQGNKKDRQKMTKKVVDLLAGAEAKAEAKLCAVYMCSVETAEGESH